MAQLDTRVTALRSAPPKFELKIHDVQPEDILPNGDRYVIEVVEIDDKIELGTILAVFQDPKVNPRDPMADPQVEQRGVIVGVVVSAGNGHLLGLPDHALVVSEALKTPLPSGHQYEDVIRRAKADVPMFYSPGDVVFVDRNSKGRALRILGRECRIVNQIDVLASVPKVKLQRTEDGGWTQVAE